MTKIFFGTKKKSKKRTVKSDQNLFLVQKKKSKKRTVKSDQKCFGTFWLPVPHARQCKKKKALKSDQNIFSGGKKKIEKKKALKSDQNVFRTFCSAPYPPREYVKFLTVKSDAIFF